MPKDKIRNIEEKKTNVVHYEVLGLTFIFLSLLTLSNVGRLGQALLKLSKFLFGDWYWLLIVIIIINSVYVLVFHKTLEFTSIRFCGILCILLSLLILSHFPVYRYLQIQDENVIRGTWNIYVSYLKVDNQDVVLGGGLIGGIIFGIISFFFGGVGVILFSVLLLIVGLSFVSTKSIIDSLNLVLSSLKRSFGVLFKIDLKMLKINNKADKEPKTRLPKKNKPLSINLLSNLEFENSTKLEEGLAVTTSKTINNILNVLNIEFELDSINVGPTITQFIYRILTNVDIKKLRSKLEEILEQDFLMAYKNETLEITTNNKFRCFYTVKQCFDGEEIILGIDTNLRKVVFNHTIHKHILIIGGGNSSIQTFVNSYLLQLYFLHQTTEFKLFFFDGDENFYHYEDVSNVISYRNDDYLVLQESINIEIDKRLEELALNGVSSLVEYNKISTNKMPRVYFVINSLEKINGFNENKFMNSALVAEKVGVHYLVITHVPSKISQILKNVLPLKVMFKVNNRTDSANIIDLDYGYYLLKKGDSYLKYQNTLLRMQGLYVSNDDLKKVLNQVKE